jgi:putative intracellular protease/amidase
VEAIAPTGRRVAVLVEGLYEDLELWYPALRLREAGAQVVDGNLITSRTPDDLPAFCRVIVGAMQ